MATDALPQDPINQDEFAKLKAKAKAKALA